jgi:hypothetical protein
LLGASLGLLIAMALLMKWLMEHQVEAAAQRRAQEAVVRAAAARCFELASPRAVDACRKTQEEVGGSSDSRLISGDSSRP